MEKKPTNRAMWITLCILAAIIMATAIFYVQNKDKISEFINPEMDTELQSNVNCTDTIDYSKESVTTIQDYLDLREEILKSRHIDSVFLTMPEPILIDILTQLGTDLSIKDIVYIYEGNKSIYNKVLDGAKAQKLKDSLEQVKEDTSIIY